MNELNDLEILTINQISKTLKVSQRTIYRMIERNSINFLFKIDGSWRCKKCDLENWIENLKIKNVKEREWNKNINPPCSLQDDYFLVFDGEKFSIARWANLCSDNPDCGADQDEYEFKKDHFPYVEPVFWFGPIYLPDNVLEN